jgi:hypothetical protein
MMKKALTVLLFILLGAISAFAQTPPGGYGPSISGGGVGSGAAPVMAYYLGSSCPVANTGQCFNTPANVRVDNTCTWSNASTTVTCTDTPFAAGDVGKQVMGWNSCGTDQPVNFYTAGTITSGTTVITISSVTDSNHAVLSATPANTQATAGCFIFGNTDDAGASALDAAYSTQAGFCPKILLAGGQYFFSKPHFTAQPPGCSTLPGIVGSPTYGNLDLPDGLEVEGRGTGNTVIYLTNNFPNGASKVTNNSISSWFAIPPLGGWRDLQISGGGQAGTCAGTTGGDVLIYMAVGKIADVTLTNFCSIPGNATGGFFLTIGIYADLLNQFNRFNMSAFGARALRIQGAGQSTGFQVAIENSGTMSLDVQAASSLRSFSCTDCFFTGAMTFNAGQQGNNWGVVNVGGNATVRLKNTIIFNCPAVNCNTQRGVPILINMAGSGSKIFLDGVNGGFINPGTNTSGFGGPYCGTGHTCSVFIRDSSLFHPTAGGSFTSFNSGDVFTDEGGNNLDIGAWGFVTAATAPTVIADGRSLTGTCTGVATASSTLGLYNTDMNPSNTTTTCTSATVGAGYAMTQARKLQGLFCSSSATTVSVACTVMVNGSPSAITCTMTAAKTCQDFTHSVALNSGDLVSERIVTGAAETGSNIKMQMIWQ